MAEYQSCGRDTDRRTLSDDLLCSECAEWIEDHEDPRDADQQGLGAFEPES